jgi:predicted  nucleic acid-binding Zn-ribbon protein
MINLFSGMLSQQTANMSARDGLPYWTFWLLLSFILLLLAFIFLRDKELRRKMDEFFFRTRRRLIKYRHQRRMARESRKKELLILEIGQKAWERRIEIKNGNKVFRELQYLEEKSEKLQKEAAEIKAKISFLNTNQDENTKKCDAHLSEKEDEKTPHVNKLLEFKSKEKEIETEIAEKQKELETMSKDINSLKKDLLEVEEDGLEWDDEKKAEVKGIQDKINLMEKDKETLDKKIKALLEKKAEDEKQKKKNEKYIEGIEKEISKIEHDKKHQTREYQKEIKEWEKNEVKVSDRIQKVVKEREPLFGEYGSLVERERPSDRELDVIYSQVDRVMARIEEIEKLIEALD